METRNDLLTKQQLADALSVPVAEVSAMVRAREIPPFNVLDGRQKFWSRDFTVKNAAPNVTLHFENVPEAAPAENDVPAGNEVSDAQADAFIQTVKASNFPDDSLLLLRTVISSGSNSIFTNELLAEKAHLKLYRIPKALKSLKDYGVIKCVAELDDNRKRIGTRIIVNYEFKKKEEKQPSEQSDKVTTLLMNVDNAIPCFSLQAKGILSHYLANIGQKEELHILTSSEYKYLNLSDHAYEKYRKELIDRSVISVRYGKARTLDAGTYIKINYDWKSDIAEALNDLPDAVSLPRLSKLLSEDRFLAKMIKGKHLPDYDIRITNNTKLWNKHTLVEFFRSLVVQK